MGRLVLHPVFTIVIAALAAPSLWAEPPSPNAFPVQPEAGSQVDEDLVGCTIRETAEDGRALFQGTTWPGGVVPYTFAANVDATNQSRAIAAMGEIEAVSSVRFIARTTEPNSIRFVSSSGNSSFVGMIGGSQDVSIYNWTFRFIIVHELLHALGDWHEQQRPDRDAYVQINWSNIESGYSGNFTTRSAAQVIGPYDFDSVMHYPSCGFSVCTSCTAACYTIQVLPQYANFQSSLGQRSHLSDGDILFLTSIYGGGEVYNQTDDVYSLSIAEAIDLASSGDSLISTSRRFSMESTIDFGVKALALESYAAIDRPAGSTTMFSPDVSLRSGPGADMTLSGGLAVPAFGVADLVAQDLTVQSAGVVNIGDSAAALFDATSLVIWGDVAFGSGAQGSTVAGATMQVNPGGVLALGSDATFSHLGDAVILGSLLLSPGSDLTVAGEFDVGADATLDVAAPMAARAGSAATLHLDGLTMTGELQVAAGGMLDVHAAAVFADSSARWVLGDGAGASVGAPLGSQLNGEVTVGVGASLVFSHGVTVGDPSFGRTFDAMQAGPSITTPQGVAIGDYDGDGDADIVVASLTLGDVFALQNDGLSPAGFVKRNVSLNVNGAVGVTMADVDSDGDMDVLSAGNIAGRFYLHENLGGNPPTFNDRTISTLADGAYSIEAADLDGDGDLDIVGASANNSTVAWFENDGAKPPTFTRHVVDAAASGATSAVVADLNGDGHLDIVASLRDANAVRWYEHDGGADPLFASRLVAGGVDLAFDVAIADMDDDGDPDVVSASQLLNSVFWHENSGGLSPTFQTRLVADQLSGVIAVGVADLNDDGFPDVVAASQAGGRVVALRSDGGSPPTFNQMYADLNVPAASGVAIGPVDADGDVDIVATSRTGNRVSLYSQRIPGAFVLDNGTLASQSIVVQGALRLAAGATLQTGAMTLGQGAELEAGSGQIDIAGALDVQIGPNRVGLRDAVVSFSGDAATLEAFSPDLGTIPGLGGLDDPTLGAIGELRVLGGGVVDLVDVANGQARAPEALYVDRLQVDAGGVLNTNGLKIYYATLALEGSVDDAGNLLRLGSCAADMNGDSVVDGADLAFLLSAWGTNSTTANIAGDPVVNGEDLAALLAAWGACPT